MSPCQLWQADPGSAGNGVKDTSSFCTWRSVSDLWHIHRSSRVFLALVHWRSPLVTWMETACSGKTILDFNFNLKKKKRDPWINWEKNTAIVLGPTQQNVKKDDELFPASILVELIKVFLAGRKMQMLTKSMHPSAKSTDTSEQIWHIPQTRNTYTHAHVYTRAHTQRQICDTECPCDPYVPYGQEEGRKKQAHSSVVDCSLAASKAPGSLVLKQHSDGWYNPLFRTNAPVRLHIL